MTKGTANGTFSLYQEKDGSHSIHLKVVYGDKMVWSRTTSADSSRAVTGKAIKEFRREYPGINVKFHEDVVPDHEIDSLPEYTGDEFD